MVSSLSSQSHWGATICCGSGLMLLGMQLGFCHHPRARAVNNSGVQSWNRKYWTGDNLRLLFVLSNNGTREHPHLLLADVSTEREKSIKCAFFPISYPKECVTSLKAGRNTGLKHSGGRISASDHFCKTGAPSSQGIPAAPIERGQKFFFPEFRNCWGQNKSPWPRMEQPARTQHDFHPAMLHCIPQRDVLLCKNMFSHTLPVCHRNPFLTRTSKETGPRQEEKTQISVCNQLLFSFYFNYLYILAKIHLLIDTNCSC